MSTQDAGAAAAGAAAAPTAEEAAATAAAAAATPAAAAPGTDAAAAAAGATKVGDDAGAAAKAAADAATAKAAADAAAAAGPPEKYTLTLPEGGPLDAADLAAFETLARTEGLTNEAAQQVLAKHSAALVARSTQFLDETRAHAEVGGDKLAAAQLQATAVVDRFLPADTPEGQRLRAVLTKEGLGSFAPFVVLMSRIGKAMQEDQPLSDRSSRDGAGKRSHADILFGR